MTQLSKLTKSLAFITSVLAVSLSLGYAVLAWTGPSQNPPNCISGTLGCDAPINTGIISQVKSGNLQVNGLGVQGTLNALLVPNGNIGIGTSDTSTGRLVVSGGNIDVTNNKIINVAAPTAATDVATKSYVDAAGGGISPTIRLIRMTVAKYNANLGGYAGANNKCNIEYPNTHFCTTDETPMSKYYDKIPRRYDYANITINSVGWLAPGVGSAGGSWTGDDCKQWTDSAGPTGDMAATLKLQKTPNESYNYYGYAAGRIDCNNILPLWCCEN